MQCKNVQKQSIISPYGFTNNDNQVHEYSVQTITSLFSTFTLDTSHKCSKVKPICNIHGHYFKWPKHSSFLIRSLMLMHETHSLACSHAVYQGGFAVPETHLPLLRGFLFYTCAPTVVTRRAVINVDKNFWMHQFNTGKKKSAINVWFLSNRFNFGQ